MYCAKTRPPDHITPHHITPHRITSHITSRQRLSPQTVPKHPRAHHAFGQNRPRTPLVRMPAAHTFGQNRPRTPSVRMPAAHTFGQNDRKLPEGVRRWAFSGVSKTSPQTTPQTTHVPDPSQSLPRGVPDPRESAHQFGQTAGLRPYRDPLTSRLSCASGVSIGDSGGPLPRPPSQASLRPPLSRAPPTPARGPLHMHTGNAATFHMTGVPGQLPQISRCPKP